MIAPVELKGKGLYMMQKENAPRKKPRFPPKETYELKVPLITGMGKLTSRRGIITQTVQAEITEFREE